MSDPSSHDDVTPLLSGRLARIVFVALLLFVTPLMVCAPVTSDVSLFDVQALTVIKGGVLYRDVLEPNLPGIVWLHLLLRFVVGWSSEAIRAADLVIVGASLWLLGRLIQRYSRRTGVGTLFALTAALFYVTRNEWCHCQRDVWLLLPVSGALWFRFSRQQSGGFGAVAEGVVWGIAFWIKPHIAIPASATMVVDSLRWPTWTLRCKDLVFIVVGGLAAAVPGIAWLIKTGAWEHFWDMMLQWNPEYVATGRTRQSWVKWSHLLQRFWPWWLVHGIAVPLAAQQIIRGFRTHAAHETPDFTAPFAACYLSWLFQTCTLQHAMDYIHVPEIILALGVIAAYPWRLPVATRRYALLATLLLSVLTMPQLRNGRARIWWTCVTQGTSPAVQEILAQGNLPDWKQLDHVRTYLQKCEVEDYELTCVNVHTIHLHKELAILPSTRYWSLSHPLTMYPSRHSEILDVVSHSRHRFVVVDQRESGIPNQVLPLQIYERLPPVFHAGDYVVYDAGAIKNETGTDVSTEPVGVRERTTEARKPRSRY